MFALQLDIIFFCCQSSIYHFIHTYRECIPLDECRLIIWTLTDEIVFQKPTQKIKRNHAVTVPIKLKITCLIVTRYSIFYGIYSSRFSFSPLLSELDPIDTNSEKTNEQWCKKINVNFFQSVTKIRSRVCPARYALGHTWKRLWFKLSCTFYCLC